MGQYGIYIYDINVDLRQNEQKRRCSFNQDLTASRGETSIKNQAWLCEWGPEFFAYLRISIYIATNSHIGQHDVAEDI